jgi:glycosyltransferase involved in cell wall biosynthesis
MSKIEFIIPTYNRFNELRVLLSSLIVQTNNNWKATVVIDDAKIWNEVPIIHPQIEYICTGRRYNDWGHTPRELGKQRSESEYIIMTGDDNYYMPTLVEEIIKIVITNPAIVYWNMVHNYFGYSIFNCNLASWQIDMGSFATRNDIAKQIHLRIDKIDADGYFIEEYKHKFPHENSIKIDKILFIHN